jgi:hypothetical protein
MNNIWDTNFPAQQQGETTFRYAIASAPAADPRVLGSATAAGLTDPLIAVPLGAAGGQGAPPPAERCFAMVDHPLVRITGLGSSRRDHDLVVYLASVSDEQVTARLTVAGMRAGWLGTSLERELRPVAVDGGTASVVVPANGFVAVSVDRTVQ